MKRWHEDYNVSFKERRKLLRHVNPNNINQDLGRFRKKHGLDCGTTQCYICHGDKFPKRLKHEQELLSELSFREQMREQ